MDEENPFPEKSEFSLSDAAWETAEPFIALASAGGKTCILNIEDHLMMTGERAAIQQTVSILLDNAIKYSAAGGRITLTLRCQRKKKKEILVSSSCAPGPLPDTQRLFDRFYRGNESHSTQDGTGIGLSIAQATVQAHGGSICAGVQRTDAPADIPDPAGPAHLSSAHLTTGMPGMIVTCLHDSGVRPFDTVILYDYAPSKCGIIPFFPGIQRLFPEICPHRLLRGCRMILQI